MSAAERLTRIGRALSTGGLSLVFDAPTRWGCPRCAKKNDISRTLCSRCGAPRGSGPVGIDQGDSNQP